jgi:hypothetical protein
LFFKQVDQVKILCEFCFIFRILLGVSAVNQNNYLVHQGVGRSSMFCVATHNFRTRGTQVFLPEKRWVVFLKHCDTLIDSFGAQMV